MQFFPIKLSGGHGVWINRDKIQSVEHLKEGGCRLWVEDGDGLEKFDCPHDGNTIVKMLNGD